MTTRDLSQELPYATWVPLELDLHEGDLADFCVARQKPVELRCLFQEYITTPTLTITREMEQIDTIMVADEIPDPLLCTYR